MCFALLVGLVVAGPAGVAVFLFAHVVHASIERRVTFLEGRVTFLEGRVTFLEGRVDKLGGGSDSDA